MSYNLIFIDESESMQRAITAILQDNTEFNLNLIKEPSSIYKAAKNFKPDIIVLSYNTIDTDLKKSITELKTSKEFAETPLLLLVPSDLSDKERDVLIKLKTDGFIYRPFDKDTFILKVKKTLSIPDEDKSGKISGDIASENKKNDLNEFKYSAENNAVKSDKTFDISDFETKKNNENLGFQNISNALSPKENNNNEGGYENAASDTGNSDIESAELSQAFENLFKDDAIFKEFQELNKKDDRLSTDESSYDIKTGTAESEAATSDATRMQETETSSVYDITQTGEEKNEPAISIIETQNKLETEPALDVKKTEEPNDIPEIKISEPFSRENIQEAQTESVINPFQSINDENKHEPEEIDKSAEPLWSIESSDSFESNPLNELMSSLNVNQTPQNQNLNNQDDTAKGIFDMSAPESGLEINVDSLKGAEELPNMHPSAAADEKTQPDNQDFNEPFAGFNIALSEEKTSTEEKGELKLKILNEQNLADMDSYLKNAIESAISEIKPDIAETVKNMLPDIIEKIVKDEIEKIKQS
jgi:DNA-binding response OmpR family regulator